MFPTETARSFNRGTTMTRFTKFAAFIAAFTAALAAVLALNATTPTYATNTAGINLSRATLSATGSFALTTAPGVVPALTSAGITIDAISPATKTVYSLTGSARIFLPVVAKTGTANAMAGGFKFTNAKTRESISCFIPTVDTRARVIDCRLNTGFNNTLFAIDDIEDREFLDNGTIRTSVFTGMEIALNSDDSAELLNDTLDTTVFSSSVTFATGSLTVTRTLE
jgi:hypothetical protein